MSVNLLLDSEDQAVIWRGPLIGKAIQQFWSDVLWGDLDYLLIDLPPGTSDAPLTVLQSLPMSGVLLVTSPQNLAGMVVRKAAHMVRDIGIPTLVSRTRKGNHSQENRRGPALKENLRGGGTKTL
jgi:Mrp family chromosome partitioning ATPase